MLQTLAHRLGVLSGCEEPTDEDRRLEEELMMKAIDNMGEIPYCPPPGSPAAEAPPPSCETAPALPAPAQSPKPALGGRSPGKSPASATSSGTIVSQSTSSPSLLGADKLHSRPVKGNPHRQGEEATGPGEQGAKRKRSVASDDHAITQSRMRLDAREPAPSMTEAARRAVGGVHTRVAIASNGPLEHLPSPAGNSGLQGASDDSSVSCRTVRGEMMEAAVVSALDTSDCSSQDTTFIPPGQSRGVRFAAGVCTPGTSSPPPVAGRPTGGCGVLDRRPNSVSPPAHMMSPASGINQMQKLQVRAPTTAR